MDPRDVRCTHEGLSNVIDAMAYMLGHLCLWNDPQISCDGVRIVFCMQRLSYCVLRKDCVVGGKDKVWQWNKLTRQWSS